MNHVKNIIHLCNNFESIIQKTLWSDCIIPLFVLRAESIHQFDHVADLVLQGKAYRIVLTPHHNGGKSNEQSVSAESLHDDPSVFFIKCRRQQNTGVAEEAESFVNIVEAHILEKQSSSSSKWSLKMERLVIFINQ